MSYCIASILPPPCKTNRWPTLPTIKEEPSISHVMRKSQREQARKLALYKQMLDDLKFSGAFESNVEHITKENTEILLYDVSIP
jgi:hypothetical protein